MDFGFSNFLNTVDLYSSKPYNKRFISENLSNGIIDSQHKTLEDLKQDAQQGPVTVNVACCAVNHQSAENVVNKVGRKRKTTENCLVQSLYSKDQWLASEIAGTLKKNRILPLSVVPFVLSIGKKPDLSNPIEKQYWQRSMDESVGRMKACLFDRMKGGVNKYGKRLFIGSWKGSCFEDYFGRVWQGERKICSRRHGTGKNYEDWSIEVRYKFHKGHDFLKEISAKTKKCIDETLTEETERQEIHYYTYLEFNWNIFNGNVTCRWSQESWKRVNGNWVPIY